MTLSRFTRYGWAAFLGLNAAVVVVGGVCVGEVLRQAQQPTALAWYLAQLGILGPLLWWRARSVLPEVSLAVEGTRGLRSIGALALRDSLPELEGWGAWSAVQRGPSDFYAICTREVGAAWRASLSVRVDQTATIYGQIEPKVDGDHPDASTYRAVTLGRPVLRSEDVVYVAFLVETAAIAEAGAHSL